MTIFPVVSKLCQISIFFKLSYWCFDIRVSWQH